MTPMTCYLSSYLELNAVYIRYVKVEVWCPKGRSTYPAIFQVLVKNINYFFKRRLPRCCRPDNQWAAQDFLESIGARDVLHRLLKMDNVTKGYAVPDLRCLSENQRYNTFEVSLTSLTIMCAIASSTCAASGQQMLYELGSWGLGVGSLTPEADLDQNTEYKLSQSNCAPEYTSDKKQFLSQLHTLTSVNIFSPLFCLHSLRY